MLDCGQGHVVGQVLAQPPLGGAGRRPQRPHAIQVLLHSCSEPARLERCVASLLVPRAGRQGCAAAAGARRAVGAGAGPLAGLLFPALYAALHCVEQGLAALRPR